MDYSKYKFSIKQWMAVTAAYVVFDFMIAELFYNSLIAAAIFLPGYIIFVKMAAKWFKERRKRQLKMQFREWMLVLYSMIAVGVSLETAIKDSWKAMADSAQKDNFLYKEIGVMVKKMAVNVSGLTCLEDFARRSCDEDIYNFYEVMNIARQQGGSMRQIIRESIDRINERIEMECEISTVIAGKKHEFLIMTCIPMGMIVYMRLGSPELMALLYEGIAGRIIMTISLAAYGIAVYWGIRITKIEA